MAVKHKKSSETYDQWFRKEVAEGIREADRGELVPLDKAMGDVLNEMERKSHKKR